MQIVTGYAGESHITSNDDQGRNQGIFGASSYVLNVGSKFAITTVSANEYQIADGEAVHQGVHFRVEPGSYDTINIDNGTQGMYRKDLIVARYTKNGSTGVETMTWEVIKGTESSSSAAVPSYTTGDILGGDYVVDMPMYVITLNGVNVSSVTARFSTLVPMATLLSRVSSAETSISNHTTSIAAINARLGKNRFALTNNANMTFGLGIGYYDKSTQTCRIFFVFSGSTSFSTTDTLFSGIPSDYIPTSNYGGVFFGTNSSNAMAFRTCAVNTNGTITQNAGSAITSGFGWVEYSL